MNLVKSGKLSLWLEAKSRVRFSVVVAPAPSFWRVGDRTISSVCDGFYLFSVFCYSRHGRGRRDIRCRDSASFSSKTRLSSAINTNILTGSVSKLACFAMCFHSWDTLSYSVATSTLYRVPSQVCTIVLTSESRVHTMFPTSLPMTSSRFGLLRFAANRSELASLPEVVF
jgi:hypothetical protein